ncbi:MAG: response regulator [Hyphomonadaceae bacterium]|nr:response regulator [Hyphomonadaceae bacterium]
MTGDDAEHIFKILVVEDRVFQRRLITETLRALGRVIVDHADCGDHALQAIGHLLPDMVITDWDLDGGQGLAFVKRLRGGEAGEMFRRLPVIMAAGRGKVSVIEGARNAGVDEFVLRPFSTEALLRRVREVQARRRDFIESMRYVGPCRRRRRQGGYEGPRRRLFDTRDKEADAPDLQIRKGLASTYAERMTAALASLDSPESVRNLCLMSGQLATLAQDMKDHLLMSATSSLFNYVKGVGAEAALNTEVVRAHLEAITQLASLPNSQAELRRTVTQQLSVMVTKKLRQAGEAA